MRDDKVAYALTCAQQILIREAYSLRDNGPSQSLISALALHDVNTIYELARKLGVEGWYSLPVKGNNDHLTMIHMGWILTLSDMLSCTEGRNRLWYMKSPKASVQLPHCYINVLNRYRARAEVLRWEPPSEKELSCGMMTSSRGWLVLHNFEHIQHQKGQLRRGGFQGLRYIDHREENLILEHSLPF